jgi:hypothetical protein
MHRAKCPLNYNPHLLCGDVKVLGQRLRLLFARSIFHYTDTPSVAKISNKSGNAIFANWENLQQFGEKRAESQLFSTFLLQNIPEAP